VKMIAMRCAGFDRVDLAACADYGIKVARVPTYSPTSVAEHAVSLLMALNRCAGAGWGGVGGGVCWVLGGGWGLCVCGGGCWGVAWGERRTKAACSVARLVEKLQGLDVC
jgi:hypothetical protein